MRYRSLLPGALALGTYWLAGCGDTATEPNRPAEPAPSGPELAVVSNSWITRANLSTNRTGLAIATITNAAGQSIVYAIGGETNGEPVNKVTAYNVATNTWTSRRSLPVPLAWSNGAGVINGKIYVSGGYNFTSAPEGDLPTRALYVYDPGTNTWTRKHDLPGIRAPFGEEWMFGAYGVTGVINGKLYVVTSCLAADVPWGYYVSTCGLTGPRLFRYNPATDRWAALAPPFPAATSADRVWTVDAGGVIAGKLYVMAGNVDRTGLLAVYDPATNQWTRKTPLGLERPDAATAVLGNKLYVMGGTRYNRIRDVFETLDITIVYDPLTDAWTRRASLPSPRASIAGTTVMLSGKPRIELVGGSFPGNNLQYIP